MFVLPQTAEYALRAVLQIAARHPLPVRVPELARTVDAPANYLSKTLNQLARAGVLASMRGPAGGFRLTKSPAETPLAAIVRVFQGDEPRRCLLGNGPCGVEPTCAIHDRWKPVSTDVERFFATTTIAQLIPASPSVPLSDVVSAAGGRR